jgi:streptomycin 6-kinase
MLPEALADKAKAVWGEQGRDWVTNFHQTLATICRLWKVSSVVPFADLSYNFVASGRRNLSEPVVLKLGVPRKELETEATCLSVYDGRGAVKLLAQDQARGALLLEKLRPGESLWSTWSFESDDRHTEIAANCMNNLWRQTDVIFPTTEDWSSALSPYLHRFSDTGPLPIHLVQKAKVIFSELESSTSERWLLHGDLHHGNILSGWNEWKAIDPKGVLGDRAFEAGAFIRNPVHHILQSPNLKELIERRLKIIAEITGLDLQSLKHWSFCSAVLSACWSLEEEGDGWKESIACAQALV